MNKFVDAEFNPNGQQMLHAKREYRHSFAEDPIEYERMPPGEDWLTIPVRSTSIIIIEFGPPQYTVYRFKPKSLRRTNNTPFFADYEYRGAADYGYLDTPESDEPTIVAVDPAIPGSDTTVVMEVDVVGVPSDDSIRAAMFQVMMAKQPMHVKHINHRLKEAGFGPIDAITRDRLMEES